MAIKDGQVADADEVMNAFGLAFKNSMNSFFNSDYDGWNAKLADAGTPQVKNLIYDTLQTDSADVNWGWNYDATNDLYTTVDLSSANLIHFDIYATSVNTSTLTDSANDIFCFQVGTGVWRLYSWKTSTDRAVHIALQKLFDGVANAATDPNGVTGLTDLRCSESTYRSHKVVFIAGSTGGGSGLGYVDMDFSASGTKYYFNYYAFSNSGNPATGSLEGPDSTAHVTNTNGVHDYRGTTVGNQFWSWTGNSGRLSGTYFTHQLTVLYPDTETLTSGTSGGGGGNITAESSPISISATAPDTGTYPDGISTLIFKDTAAATATNTLSTWNASIDATSTFVASISYDGGSNYETITDATIQRNTNTGTAVWLKLVNTRTDLSKIDTVMEWATAYNWY